MSALNVTITTPHGPVTLPFAQVARLGDALRELRARGAEDVAWHKNDCGCCVAAHGREGGRIVGYVIDADGGADWHDHDDWHGPGL